MILLIVNKDYPKNDITRLSCKKLIALDGYPASCKLAPLGGYVYDGLNDAYVVNCVDHCYLGIFPVSFRIKFVSTGNWGVDMPIPENLLKSFFNESQRETVKRYHDMYPQDDFEFQYIQFLVC